ncbi:hypothetical protein KY289_006234 [Solanum tuberosum]|nr:hypothetical protein KY284_005931 [Solanum tuberosum]KAH0723190.1 hypothetical protein KY289_006234 [Solanum tuberosum]
MDGSHSTIFEGSNTPPAACLNGPSNISKHTTIKNDGLSEIPKKWKGICKSGTLMDMALMLLPLLLVVLLKGASYFGYATGTARDGVDILTISYGWTNIPLYEDSIAIASFGAMMKGVLVSASAGNSGPEMGTLNNGVPWIFTVAACDSDRSFSGTLTLGNGLKITGFSLFPVKTIIKDLRVLYNESISPCDSFDPSSPIPIARRSIIICYSTAVDVEDQMAAISESSFGGAIYISDYPDVLRANFFPNPGVVISTKEGKQVIDYASKSVRPTASISFQETHIDVKSAPVVSSFSSRGPSRSYLRVAKPDIVAPGVLILAAWLSNVSAAVIGVNTFLDSDYRLLSGTSMATPHIAGIVAMLKGAHPDWSPSAIRSAMMTTANPLDNTDKPIKTTYYFITRDATSLDMGTGLVDPNRAVDPGLIYDATPQDYKFRRTVTNVGAGAAKYVAKVIAPKNSTISISPQTLVFEKKNQKQDYTLTIRYKGIADDQAQSGSITWVEKNGHHTVRSPIVVAPALDAWTGNAAVDITVPFF